MAPIYAEISVSRENNWFGNRFAHPNKTRISEAHWHICVLPHERKNLLDIGLQPERANNSTAAKKFDQGLSAVDA
jgi:hypothetical protein